MYLSIMIVSGTCMYSLWSMSVTLTMHECGVVINLILKADHRVYTPNTDGITTIFCTHFIFVNFASSLAKKDRNN